MNVSVTRNTYGEKMPLLWRRGSRQSQQQQMSEQKAKGPRRSDPSNVRVATVHYQEMFPRLCAPRQRYGCERVIGKGSQKRRARLERSRYRGFSLDSLLILTLLDTTRRFAFSARVS